MALTSTDVWTVSLRYHACRGRRRCAATRSGRHVISTARRWRPRRARRGVRPVRRVIACTSPPHRWARSRPVLQRSAAPTPLSTKGMKGQVEVRRLELDNDGDDVADLHRRHRVARSVLVAAPDGRRGGVAERVDAIPHVRLERGARGEVADRRTPRGLTSRAAAALRRPEVDAVLDHPEDEEQEDRHDQGEFDRDRTALVAATRPCKFSNRPSSVCPEKGQNGTVPRRPQTRR